MKNENYVTPLFEVIEIEIENVLCSSPGVEGMTNNGSIGGF